MSLRSRPLRVAIVGGGPSGCALAILLARKGCHTALWDPDGNSRDLVVGESLIPAVIPALRNLGIEDSVAALGVPKPGVSFAVDSKRTIRFSFSSVKGVLPTYAYNVPRPQFDHILKSRATRCGTTVIPHKAAVTYDPISDRLSLSPDSLRDARWPAQPDLLVDATGRRRLFSAVIGIPHRDGPRKDRALFAHFTGVPPLAGDPPGQVVIARSSLGGWSWRIPLRHATSVGTVIPEKVARDLASSPAERLDAAIAADPLLRSAMAGSHRVSDVATYANYQRISNRGWGRNWVLLGDALGFVDPMLSPGLCLALNSAQWLAHSLPNHPDSPLAPVLDSYATKFFAELEAWSELVGHFYAGRVFNLYFSGGANFDDFRNPLSRFMATHVSKHIACMCAGAFASHRYSRNLLKFSTDHGADPAGAAALSIR